MNFEVHVFSWDLSILSHGIIVIFETFEILADISTVGGNTEKEVIEGLWLISWKLY